jgi:Holliday junction resolvase RusA-like endonuclease
MKSKMKGPPMSGPLQVDMEFYFVKPKSAKRTHHTVKPDVDNVVKAVLDNGNGIIWEDDRQIVKITASKCYADVAKTVINIRGIDA